MSVAGSGSMLREATHRPGAKTAVERQRKNGYAFEDYARLPSE
jgi:hypothetical protein